MKTYPITGIGNASEEVFSPLIVGFTQLPSYTGEQQVVCRGTGFVEGNERVK